MGRAAARAMTARTLGAPAAVSRWEELPGERRPLGIILRVLVAGQHAGTIEHDGGAWQASWYGTRGTGKARMTRHPTANEAVRAVLRSPFACRLGARATSRVHWTAKASNAVSNATRQQRLNGPGQPASH
jgi:hypothetical protein